MPQLHSLQHSKHISKVTIKPVQLGDVTFLTGNNCNASFSLLLKAAGELATVTAVSLSVDQHPVEAALHRIIECHYGVVAELVERVAQCTRQRMSQRWWESGVL